MEIENTSLKFVAQAQLRKQQFQYWESYGIMF